MSSDELTSKHARYVLNSWTQSGSPAPMMVRGEGSYLFDVDGKPYLDLGSGLVAVNLGHGHPRVVRAIQEQAAALCYSPPSFFHDKRAELAAELSAMSPWSEGCRTFFTTSGAEANDDAVRLARAITSRAKVLTAYRSFHGSTGMSIMLSGENRRWGGEPGPPSVMRFLSPYPYRSPFHASNPAEEAERAIQHLELVLMHEDPRRVAAILIEPVVGSNGVIVYPEGYLGAVRALTERHGILLIFDEVMTGFGRTGAAFGATRFGVEPDMITFAKGVTSAYVPLGGVMLREKHAAMFETTPLPCGHTYSGHPLCAAAGLATVRAYREDGIFERARTLEDRLREGLQALAAKHRSIGDVRGVGGLFGIELVKDRTSKEPLVPWQGDDRGLMKEFYKELRARGVYAFGRFNCVMITPPLTIENQDLEKGLAALDGALDWLESRP